MTIPEIKKKWKAEYDRIIPKQILTQSLLLKYKASVIKDFLTDLDTLPECNGKVIDYVKETCTSCGCENHKTE